MSFYDSHESYAQCNGGANDRHSQVGSGKQIVKVLAFTAKELG